MTSARPLHRRGARLIRFGRGPSEAPPACPRLLGEGAARFQLVRDRSRFRLARGCSKGGGARPASALFGIASAYLGVRRPAVPFAGFGHAVYPGVFTSPGRVLYCKHFITVEW